MTKNQQEYLTKHFKKIGASIKVQDPVRPTSLVANPNWQPEYVYSVNAVNDEFIFTLGSQIEPFILNTEPSLRHLTLMLKMVDENDEP